MLIDNVVKDGPAFEAGLRGLVLEVDMYGHQQIIGKDILIGVDNTPVSRIDDVISYLDLNKRVGDNLLLAINRDGQILNLTSTLAPRPPISLFNNTSTVSPVNPQPYNPYSLLPSLPKLPQLPNFKLPQLPNFKLPHSLDKYTIFFWQ